MGTDMRVVAVPTTGASAEKHSMQTRSGVPARASRWGARQLLHTARWQ